MQLLQWSYQSIFYVVRHAINLCNGRIVSILVLYRIISCTLCNCCNDRIARIIVRRAIVCNGRILYLVSFILCPLSHTIRAIVRNDRITCIDSCNSLQRDRIVSILYLVRHAIVAMVVPINLISSCTPCNYCNGRITCCMPCN